MDDVVAFALCVVLFGVGILFGSLIQHYDINDKYELIPHPSNENNINFCLENIPPCNDTNIMCWLNKTQINDINYNIALELENKTNVIIWR